MTGYSRGTALENRFVHHLETNGYAVIRAAGSKGSTKADLIAIKPRQALLVQVKRGRVPSAPDWNRLVEVAGMLTDGIAIFGTVDRRGRLVMFRLTGPKVPFMRLSAMTPFLVDEIAEATS